jgi:putative nucleotidyltransferase with HDIG domain
VVVADCALPEANQGVELLDRIHTEYPKTIRILLAGELDKEHRMADVQGAYLVLTKPCDAETLKSAIERATAIDLWLTNDSLRELVSRLRTFPIVPSLYLEVTSALRSPNASTTEVGAIISKDMAMMTKLLQVTNSACFGVARKISDPVEAVGILGFETVKSMVITLKLLSQYDKVKPVYFSIDRLWRHSTEVARLSRRLAQDHEDDAVLAESAFTAGLMHDLGKLVLASNFDEQYSGAQTLARQQQIPLWEVEKQIFGASHGEIGAYLLGLWGMPLDLVETAALHHNPSRSLARRFTPLTAVHVANVLLCETKPDKQGMVPPQLDEAYLAELDLADRLPHWRELALALDGQAVPAGSQQSPSGAAKKPVSASQKNAPQTARAINGPARVLGIPRERWAIAAILTVLFVAAFTLCVESFLRTALAPPAPAVQTAARKAVATVSVPPARPPSTPGPVAAVPVAAKPAPEAAPAPAVTNSKIAAMIAPAPATVPAAPAPRSAKDMAFDDLQLQSIFYSQSAPSAVINGRLVRPKDRLPAGAVVVAIGPSSVTLEFENERKVMALK